MSAGRIVGKPLLTFGLVSGPAAWMVHLVGASALVPAACTHELGWTIDALTAATAVVCIAGIAAGLRLHRLAGPSDEPRAPGLRTLAFVIILVNVLSTALVVAEGAMHLWIGACR